jgi:hypothetical protein
MRGRVHLLQQVLAVQRLQFRRRDANQVELPAARLLLGEQPLQHLDRRGAPDVYAYAMALLEIGA